MQEKLHSVGFEPTQSKLLELESSPLDRSGTNALLQLYGVEYKNNKYAICAILNYASFRSQPNDPLLQDICIL
jgi:hypothetical protein